jgi:phosphohistidine phosphatase
MKKLYIVRHAKSSWKDLSLSDFDRPLNRRGLHNAPMMAQKFALQVKSVDLIVSSPAKRAKDTSLAFYEALESQPEYRLEQRLYESSCSDYMDILQKLDDTYNKVMIVGHNPAINSLILELIGLDENIVTTGVVTLDISCKSWRELSAMCTTLVSYEYPKMYDGR